MKKYNKYKDSGIEFISEVPKDWKITRLKNLGFLQNGVSKGKEYFGFGFPFVSYGNIYNDTIGLSNIQKLANSTNEDQKLYSVLEGDVFFTRTSETIDEIGVSATALKTIPKATFSGFVIRLRPKKNRIYKDFTKYYFQGNINRIFLSKQINIVTRASLSQSILNNLPVLLPPLNEQTQIANYLDTKTTAIDKKIKLLQQKIKHYKAYRKTLINETVTKGLDKTVKLKDSGINWIGEIPKHWEVKRIKDIFSISRGRAIGKTELKDKGLYPVYSSQTKNNGILGYINTYDFNANLLTWTTDGVNAGTVFIREGKFNCTNICGTLIPKKKPKLSLEYMAFAVQESTKHNKRIDTNGAKIMSNEMAVINIVFPPIEEQINTANHIKSKTETISKIIKNIESQITTLKELRKTLINEVVTGKAKVSA